MKLKPILFSTPMVEAILNGTKTQTRRVVKSSTGMFEIEKRNDFPYRVMELDEDGFQTKVILPKANIGDVFWVRETWQITDFLHPSDENYGYIYKASENGLEWESNTEGWKWRPSIFMPKEACRLFLKVTNVRVERLQDISEEDAIAEGIEVIEPNEAFKDYLVTDCGSFASAKGSFFSLWESINGKQSLESNPWVWIYEFKITETPI